MASRHGRTQLRRWTVLVLTLVLVAAGLSKPGGAGAAAPGAGTRAAVAVQPRGNGGWKPAKPPKSTTAPFERRAGKGGPQVLAPDPHAKRVKELTGERTANTSTFQMSDRSVQQEVSALAVHYRDAKGAWRPIDPTVKPVDHNGFTVGAEANSFQTYFSPKASALLRMEQGPAFVQVGADGAKTAAPKVTGASVSYPGAYPGADLDYQVGPEGVKESIVLSKAPKDAPSYFFTMAVGGGLVPEQLPGGAIAFHGRETDAAVFTMPAPYMSDAKADRGSPYGKVYSTEVTQSMSFDAASGTVRVTVTPDAAWLADAKRVYPVTIDPTILVSPTPSTAANTMILADSPATNYATSWRLSVGTTTTGAARTLIKFPLPSIPSGTAVSAAHMQLYYDQTFTTGSNNVPMQALQANAGWNPTTATWSTASSIGGPVAGTATAKANTSGVWVDFPVTSAVQNWVNGSANNGFVVKATNEATLGQGGPRFEGSIYAYGGEVATYPKLVITYGVPGVAVNPPAVIHATGAELSWPAYTNTTGDPANDLVEYQVHRSVFQAFTPGANTLVAPMASRSFVDSTAVPTPADSADPYGNAYYYMVAVKTKGGKLIAGPTQLVRLPKAGRTTLLIPATAATTLSSGQPNTVLNTLTDSGVQQPWLEVGNNSATYGVARSVFDFGSLGQVPAGSRINEAHLKVWQETTTTNSTGAVYELHGVTRSFTGSQATWNKATSTTAWTTPGGDFAAPVAGTVSGLTNDPNRQNFDATSIVQGWVNTAGSNHGLLVKLKGETSTSPQERTIFAGLNTAEPRLAPQLVVTYLDKSTDATYYAPSTPTGMVAGATYTTPVTVNNTTNATWSAGSEVLTYHWTLPDGTEVTGPANQLQTKLPADLAPGEAVTLNAKVTPPPASGGNKSEGYSLAWDMYDTTTATFLSAGTSGTGSLKQWVSVDPTGNNQLGLEQFYQYTTTPAGAGTSLHTNLSSGNTVWNYNLFSNPSRGFDTLLRLSYNSLSTFDTNTGFGWSMQASAPIRVGQALQIHPMPNPTEVVMVDGTGNAHKWTWDAAANAWKSPPGVHLFLQQLVSCGPQTENARAWSMTRPDRTTIYFDCDGYPAAQVDANGNEADFTYSKRQSQNKPTEFLTYITDPVVRQTLTVSYYAKGESYSYVDSAGNLVSDTNLTDPDIIDHVKSVRDVAGRTVNFYYTVQGLLGRLVDGAGDPAAKTFQFTYDATQGMKNVKLVAVEDPRGNTSRIAYYPPSSEWKWRTQSVTDRLNHITQFAYLQPGAVSGATQQTTVTDANGHNWVYQIDSAGRMVQGATPLNEKTTLAWDGDNNVSTLTENNGARTSWTYDQKTGYPLTETDAMGAGTATYTYRFSLSGHVADLTDTVSAAGRHWHYTYDAVGNMLTAQAPNGTAAGSGFTTTYAYDSFGGLVTVTDANNHTTAFSYNIPAPVPVEVYEPTGLPRSVIDPLNNVSHLTYGPRGELTEVTDPLGKTSTQNYDVFLRTLDSRVPKDQAAGVSITTPAPVYDANDNVTRGTAANGAVTSAVFDANDQTKSVTLPPDTATSPARVVSYTYDAVGNRLTTTQPNGNLAGAVPGSYTTTVSYDAANRPTTVTDALGGRTITGYDGVGNKVQLTDPLTNVTKVSYDVDHRPTGTTDPQGRTMSVRYDADGLVLDRTDQNNATTHYSLDPNGRVTQVQVPHSGSGADTRYNTTQYKYDQVGNNTSVVYPKGVASGVSNAFTTTTTFDANNRVEKVFGAYDPAADPDADYGSNNKPETDFAYDAAGQVTKVTKITRSALNPDTSATSTVSYFDNGWIKHSADPFNITTDYDYNALGQQTSRKLTASDGTASRLMTWGYYPDGKPASFTDNGVPTGWQDQIVTASSANTSITRGWEPGPAGRGFDGSTYYTNQGAGGDFSWNLTIPQDGNYTIYVWYPAQEIAGNASYSVAGSAPIVVDQSKNAGTWVELRNPANSNGEWSLKAGTGQNVVLKPGAAVTADAVRVVRDTSGDSQPLPSSISYTYDANGNRTDVTDSSPTAQFNQYSATFDQLNRSSQLQEKAAGTVKHTLTFGYDANSNLLSQTNDSTTNTYTYDSRNQVTKVVNKQSSADPGITTTYTYTPTGQRESQTKGNGNQARYQYNLDGTLDISIEETSGGTTVDSHALTYDPNLNITKDITGIQDADNGTFRSRTVDRGYNPNNQVTSVTNSDGKYNQSYTYDSAGNISRQIINGVDVSFTYDRGRLTSSLLLSADTLPVGAYQYDTLGRLFAITDSSLPGATFGVSQRYSYDGFDNITSQASTSKSGTNTVTNTTSYTYDSLNRPITANGRVNDIDLGQETINYLGTSRTVTDEQLSTVDGTGTKTYDYDLSGERLALHDDFLRTPPPTSQTSFYTYNAHQDVEALTSSSGATMGTYSYTAYGASDPTLVTGVDKATEGLPFPYNSYRFNSARVAASTGNLDMGFRTYNPNINQFLSRDAYNGASADAGLASDRYGFAGGNPVSNIEVDGHSWLSTLGSIAAGIGIAAGCLALAGVTEGAGLILCGALAGAGAGAAAQGITCAEGQAGACSAGAFGQSIAIGALTGAVAAGVGGAIAGALPESLSAWAAGAIIGAGSGAAGGAVGYGLSCTDCSWAGLATATATGAAFGGALGAGFGAASAARSARAARTSNAAQVEEMKSLADAVHGVLDPIAKEMRVTAAVRARTQTGDIVDVFAGSGKRGLNPAQREVVKQRGGVVAANTLEDAELTAYAHIASQGWKPIAGAVAGKPSCPVCTNSLLDTGAVFTGPLEPYRFLGRIVYSQSRFYW
jgi:RHS repeat-associated protein